MGVFASVRRKLGVKEDGEGPSFPKVSVLVPVYNAQDYLEKCLSELAAQTLSDIEIIAIDDESTDGSPRILAQAAADDSRIRVVSKPNEGYGKTINRGIAEARGEFIGIAEPDDYVERSMYQKLYRAAKRHGADLVKCQYFNLYEDHEDVSETLKPYPLRKAFSAVELPSILEVMPSIWAALYNRELLVREGIRCRETPGAAFQDTAFTFEALIAADRIALIPDALVHYRRDNPNSSSLSSDKINFVADEFADIRTYLKNHFPERYDALIGEVYVKQWQSVRWDYRRVQPEFRPQTAERLRADLMEAAAAGDLNLDLFSADEVEVIADLFEMSPERFVEAHPDCA